MKNVFLSERCLMTTETSASTLTQRFGLLVTFVTNSRIVLERGGRRVFITAGEWEESSSQRAGEEEEGPHQGQLQRTEGRHPDPARRQVQQSSDSEEGERVHCFYETEKRESLK